MSNTAPLSDHDLLFGVLAVQLGMATPQQVMAAAAGWAVDRSVRVAEHLERAGAVSAERRACIEEMVTGALRAHRGDAEDALESLGGKASVLQSFGGSVVVSEAGELSIDRSDDTQAPDEDPLLVTDEQPGRYSLPHEAVGHDPQTAASAELGRGGIGRVFVAHDEHLGRDVAVKELLPRASSSAGAVSGPHLSTAMIRFLREARVTGQLEHPNVIPVYELGRRPDGAFYYTMKIVRGRTLAEALAEAGDAEARTKLLGHFVDVCQAVAYAHSRGVFHRDLKPENVMLGEFGETVVLDWGLAKVRGKADLRGEEAERAVTVLRDAEAGKTVDGTAIGTPAYMSPEQAHGEITAVDERSDVWSLGAMLYEILIGRPPFTGQTAVEIIAKVTRDTIPPVRETAPQAPVELASVCDKALQRDPRRRYAGAKAIADDVEAYLVGGRVGAHEYSLGELVSRFVKRHRAAAIAVGTLFAATVTALVVVSAALEETRRAHLRGAYHLAQAHVAKADQLVDEGRLVEARLHAVAALESNPGYRGSPLFDAATASAERDLLGAHAASIFHLTAQLPRLALTLQVPAEIRVAKDVHLTPDEATLVFGDQGGGLRVFDTRTGQEIRTVEVPLESSQSSVFSPAEPLLAVQQRSGAIELWDLAPPWGHRVLFHTDQYYGRMKFSPDGEHLALGYHPAQVTVLNVETGAVERVIEDDRFEALRVAFSPDGNTVATLAHGAILLWDLRSGNLLQELPGSEVARYALAFSPDGSLLAYDGAGSSVVLWDVVASRTAGTLEGKGDKVLGIDFVADADLLVTGTGDGLTCLWRYRERALEQCVRAHPAYTKVAIGRSGRLLATSSSADDTVRLWRREPAANPRVVLPTRRDVLHVAFSPDGGTLAVTEQNNTVSVWQPAESQNEPRAILPAGATGLSSDSFSPDGRHLAAAWDQTACLWDLVKPGEPRCWPHDSRVRGVGFSPTGRLIATTARDGILRLWEVNSLELVRQLEVGARSYMAFAFNPSGELLAVSAEDSAVQVWRVASGERLRTLTGHSDLISGVSFSLDGRYLASSGKDAITQIWDARTYAPLATLTGHEEWVNRAIFSPDSRFLASISDDATAIVWSTGDWRPRLFIELETTLSSNAIAFSPDSRHLAVGQGLAVHIYPLAGLLEELDVAALKTASEAALGAALRGFEIEVVD